MDQLKLDHLAKKNAPMPAGLAMYEQCYYISARGLYNQYEKGQISLETAKKDKEEVVRQYELGKYQWELFVKLHEVEEKLGALKADPFNTALELEIHGMLEQILR